MERLLGAYRFVVADIEVDIATVVGTEATGEPDGTGLAVATLLRSDLIVVAGAGDPESLCSLVQAIDALTALVGADRVLPVVNRLPRGFKRRSAAVSEAVRLLASSAAFEAGDPVLITERDTTRRAARGGLTPPSSLVRPLSSEVRLRLATALPAGGAAASPLPPDVASE